MTLFEIIPMASPLIDCLLLPIPVYKCLILLCTVYVFFSCRCSTHVKVVPNTSLTLKIFGTVGGRETISIDQIRDKRCEEEEGEEESENVLTLRAGDSEDERSVSQSQFTFRRLLKPRQLIPDLFTHLCFV